MRNEEVLGREVTVRHERLGSFFRYISILEFVQGI